MALTIGRVEPARTRYLRPAIDDFDYVLRVKDATIANLDEQLTAERTNKACLVAAAAERQTVLDKMSGELATFDRLLQVAQRIAGDPTLNPVLKAQLIAALRTVRRRQRA